jgi:multidrug resistance efflux pump
MQQTSSLAFGSSGKVTKVNVTLGQQVKTGDVLAEIDPTDLQTALDAANANLATAQSKLNQLLDGATASALASADQSVIQARANYDKALRSMRTLQDPPTATDLASAQQAVASAEAQLGQTQQSRDRLDVRATTP